jgi:hypothetical protein
VAYGSPTFHWTIVLVDVADFTNPGRTSTHHEAVRRGMYALLEEAFVEAGVNWAACTRDDRGDGVMILVPAMVSKSLLADRLPGRLMAGLRRYNAIHVTEAAVQLRVVFHFGEISRNSNGAAGPALNDAFRLLDAPTAKAELRQSGGMLALIASMEFYRDVISQDPGADPSDYHRIPVKVKGFSSEAWLRLPGAVALNQPPAAPVIGAVAGSATDGPVLDLLSEAEQKHVHGWLADIEVPNVSELARRAAGAGIPLPRLADPWHAFTHLADFTVGPDGVPPCLLFLHALAKQVGGEVGHGMTVWVDRQVRQLRIGAAFEARCRDLARVVESRLHLLILIDRDAIDRDRFLLSFWRQESADEWPPVRGPVREVALDTVERVVDDIVVAAERAWADLRASVILEFLLPRTLLNLPVHRWHKEHDSGDPRPLCLDYQILIRSLERMKAVHWHRVWRERWHSMYEDPSVERIHFPPTENRSTLRVDAVLSDPRWVSMVAAAPADEPEGPRDDHVMAALRSGLPVLLWRPGVAPEELREIVNWLVEGGDLTDLPERTQVSRRAAFGSSTLPIDTDVARDVVILWDDPRRLIALDQPLNGSQPP